MKSPSLPHTQHLILEIEIERERKFQRYIVSHMEKSSPPKKKTTDYDEDEAKQPSCWDCIKMKYLPPWKRRKQSSHHNITTTRQRSVVGCNITSALLRTKQHPKPGGGGGGGFRYDPISYSQNFDDGGLDDDDEDASHRGFSSRYAALPTKSQLGSKNSSGEARYEV